MITPGLEPGPHGPEFGCNPLNHRVPYYIKHAKEKQLNFPTTKKIPPTSSIAEIKSFSSVRWVSHEHQTYKRSFWQKWPRHRGIARTPDWRFVLHAQFVAQSTYMSFMIDVLFRYCQVYSVTRGNSYKPAAEQIVVIVWGIVWTLNKPTAVILVQVPKCCVHTVWYTVTSFKKIGSIVRRRHYLSLLWRCAGEKPS